VAYLAFNLVSLALIAGFFVLSAYETKQGARLLADERARLDESITRIAFVLTHVDFAAFTRDLALRIAHRIVHDAAHFSLLIVRAAERFLTHFVRSLRTRHANDIVPHKNAREFVKTLSDFKSHLETTHPDVPDVY